MFQTWRDHDGSHQTNHHATFQENIYRFSGAIPGPKQRVKGRPQILSERSKIQATRIRSCVFSAYQFAREHASRSCTPKGIVRWDIKTLLSVGTLHVVTISRWMPALAQPVGVPGRDLVTFIENWLHTISSILASLWHGCLGLRTWGSLEETLATCGIHTSSAVLSSVLHLPQLRLFIYSSTPHVRRRPYSWTHL